MRKNIKGQEAIEFILISILVFFGGLFAIMTLGGKMAGFFTTDSSFAQVANQKTNVISANTSPDFQTTLKTELDNENRTTVVNYEAMNNPDGSVSVDINGQVVNLEPQDLELINTVFETTGSDGIELINAIARMLEIKATSGETDVPLEISFGTGSRSASGGGSSSTYKGTASVNTTVVKSGDDILIIQKDQICVNASGSACNFEGVYTIEGKINANNTFTSSSVLAQITDGKYAGKTLPGSFNATIKENTGLALSGTFLFNDPELLPYQWDINFSTLKAI